MRTASYSSVPGHQRWLYSVLRSSPLHDSERRGCRSHRGLLNDPLKVVRRSGRRSAASSVDQFVWILIEVTRVVLKLLARRLMP